MRSIGRICERLQLADALCVSEKIWPALASPLVHVDVSPHLNHEGSNAIVAVPKPGRQILPAKGSCGSTSAKRAPKAGRAKAGKGNPLELELPTALYALYTHYKQVFEQWDSAGIEVPPVFIVVCNNRGLT